MRDRPIIFSAPMVRGLLRELAAPGSGKTQTRRLLPKTSQGLACEPGWTPERREKGWVFVADTPDLKGRISCGERYEIGGRLWVRENYEIEPDGIGSVRILYRAGGERTLVTTDKSVIAHADALWTEPDQCRPSIHMPRWASRLTLTIADVRVQRLQEISKEDVIAEGITERDGLPIEDCVAGWHEPYAALWDSLNRKRAPWDSNPWIVALTFSVAHGNIDSLPKQVAA